MLTKTDYLRYLDAPMHLWAKVHDQLEDAGPSEFAKHLMKQGMDVQKLAEDFLTAKIAREHPGAEVSFETVLVDGNFYARLDGAVYFPEEEVWDIYEIKSGNSVSKENLYDAAFQRLVAEANWTVRDTYLLHVNKEYRRVGEIDLDGLFVAENVNQEIRELCEELKVTREMAWQVTQMDSPAGISACQKPKLCPCPSLCHPELPAYSIYDLPNIWRKVEKMRADGIRAIGEIPDGYQLTEKQELFAEAARRGQAIIDPAGVRALLDKMAYPLYFLDYESYNPAVPWFEGYGPHQHMVFQYSLHVFEAPGAEPVHFEYLATEPEDPSLGLAADLLDKIGTSGSVVVWFKGFERSRTEEMAARHPQFADGLRAVNERIYDLRDIFSQGHYVHPDFHGSTSIKAVLPVLVPDLSYDGMAVANGTDAMLAWDGMMSGDLDEAKYQQTRKELLEYCKLDTWAMVRIWQVLRSNTEHK